VPPTELGGGTKAALLNATLRASCFINMTTRTMALPASPCCWQRLA
jgi:hypothetical protein